VSHTQITETDLGDGYGLANIEIIARWPLPKPRDRQFRFAFANFDQDLPLGEF
jgi:hypothetical protein